MIETNFKIQKKHNIIESNFQDCVMLYDLETGKYFVLNEVGSLVWGQIEEKEGKIISEIIDNIASIYSNNNQQIKNDIIQFIETMIEKEIVLLGA